MSTTHNIIKLRRGTAAEWASSNPQPGGEILKLGEPGYEKDTGKLKIGDGITPWNSLSYVTAGTILIEDVDHLINEVLQAGDGVVLNFNDANDTLTISTSGINDPENNRLLTSDGTNTGINAESALTFDGHRLRIDCTCESGTAGLTLVGDQRSTSINSNVYSDPISTETEDGILTLRATSRLIFLGTRGSAASPSGLDIDDTMFIIRGDAYNPYGTLNAIGNLENRTLRIRGYVSDSGNPYLGSSLEFLTSSGSGLYDESMVFDHTGTLKINTVPVSLSGHVHDYNDITDFTGGVESVVDTLLVAGTGIELSYSSGTNSLTISSTGGGGGATITNYGDNRLLTSDGTSTGINGESALTFDGSTLGVTGAISVDNLNLDGNILSSTTGNLILNPDSSGSLQRDSGGDTRGVYAIDWQSQRFDNNQVASGMNSVIGGGSFNRAAGQGNVIGGGNGNFTNGLESVIAGGTTNQATGDYSAVCGGAQNAASGDYSFIAGGTLNNDAGYNNVFILGSNITATSSDTTYIENLSGISGNFSTGLTVNDVAVSLSGHTHTSSNILDFTSSVESIFNTSLVAGNGIGLAYNSGAETLTINVEDAPRIVTTVFNETGSQIAKMKAVYIGGGHGDLPTVELAIATGDVTSAGTYGLTYQAIDNMGTGEVIVFGALTGVNTDPAHGGIAGATEGSTLYLSPTTPGELTTTKPSAPDHIVVIGTVIRVHQNEGVIEVRIQNGFELDELHNVAISGATNGQFLQYNSSSQLWVPSSSGNFTTLQVSGTNVSVSGHTHTISNITDFPTIANSGDNRILTSTGTSTGINAESNLTYDGSTLTATSSSITGGNADGNYRIKVVRTGAYASSLSIGAFTNQPSIEWSRNAGGGALRFEDTTTGANVERMRIDHNGYVGIGNTSPSSTLHVTGDFAIDNLKIDANTISSTNSNGNIVLAPNGTGDVQVDADTLRVGDSNAAATITTNGTGNLTISTNNGTNSGSIVINQGVNGNIGITPNGTGEVDLSKVDIDGGSIDGTAIGATSASTGKFTQLYPTVVDNGNVSGSVATDVSTGQIFDMVVTGSTTLSNPTNAVNGVTVRWRITQDGTGGHSVSLDTEFQIPSSASSPLPWSTAAGATDILAATYHAVRGKWDVVAFVPGY